MRFAPASQNSFFFSFFSCTPLNFSLLYFFHFSNMCIRSTCFLFASKNIITKNAGHVPCTSVSKVKNLSDVGHYFLLVLNIRNARFEVLDSMRTLEDTNLRTCCDKLVESMRTRSVPVVDGWLLLSDEWLTTGVRLTLGLVRRCRLCPSSCCCRWRTGAKGLQPWVASRRWRDK
jgi:hypothetical protein